MDLTLDMAGLEGDDADLPAYTPVAENFERFASDRACCA